MSVTQLRKIEGSREKFVKFLSMTESYMQVRRAIDFESELLDLLKNGNQITGAKLPWGDTEDDLRFRGGEVTVWMGINGHGKSQLLGQACIGFVAQGEPVCVASFEMKPAMTLRRMALQMAQNSRPPDGFVRTMLEWLGDRFYVYDQTGETDEEVLRGVIAYAAIECGVKHFVIDSLMMVVGGEQGEAAMNGQKNFVRRLCGMARDLNIHLHLVHHSRKLADENSIPGKFDAKGSGAITDQVDQVLTVWRNKAKERQVHKNRIARVSDPDTDAKPDALLVCDKNRHGGEEKSYALWYHAPSMQYVPTSRCIPIDMMLGTL